MLGKDGNVETSRAAKPVARRSSWLKQAELQSPLKPYKLGACIAYERTTPLARSRNIAEKNACKRAYLCLDGL